MSQIQVVHTHGEAIAVSTEGLEIFRYVYRPDPSAFEGPKPYAHPLRTLAGDLVTGYRPHDHRWHKGLQFAVSHLSGHNFWGGHSYRHGEGYLPLPEVVGSMEHLGFDRVQVSDESLRIAEKLRWLTAAGEEWARETREIAVADVSPSWGTWSIRWRTAITNTRDESLLFGSPTTAGRPAAGYTGLAWRGPRSFTDGQVLGPADLGGPQMMGQRADWLAYVGKHDDVDATSTLLFEHDPSNAAEAKWFVRTEPFPIANPSLAFDQEIELRPGAVLERGWRVVVRAGGWDRDGIEDYRKAFPLSTWTG
ncbi:DUF6807 domain-containing protein [Fodinicola feengrottensis]|uniref:PmoA family protein n=1 Tax=Fodinicola feengrottensis TaxID=435914 RepID=A0ABN2HYM7_9ACTN|nr:PmoA family protein [Fodinicola feengrottensis]